MTAKEYLIYRDLIYKDRRDGKYKLNITRNNDVERCQQIIQAMEDYAEMRVNRSLDEIAKDIDQNIEQI